MRVVYFIASETFVLLRRDRIFLPAVLAGLLIAIFANLASDWSLENLKKVLFDIGSFGFHMTGSFVALFWGHRMIADSRQEGALEVQLASPVSRVLWLLGKYFGLAACLVFLGVVMLALWQLVMSLNGYGLMTRPEVTSFAFTILGWLVVAAMALLFATFTRPQVALFASLCTWLAGLVTALVANTLAPDTPAATRAVTGFLARVWDLQQFNLIDWASVGTPLASGELQWRATYGLVLLAVLLTAAALIFRRRDLA